MIPYSDGLARESRRARQATRSFFFRKHAVRPEDNHQNGNARASPPVGPCHARRVAYMDLTSGACSPWCGCPGVVLEACGGSHVRSSSAAGGIPSGYSESICRRASRLGRAESGRCAWRPHSVASAAAWRTASASPSSHCCSLGLPQWPAMVLLRGLLAGQRGPTGGYHAS